MERLRNICPLDGFMVAAHEAVIVWCSPNIDEMERYSADYLPIDIHQSVFSLKEGETVTLSKGNRILETVTIPCGIPSDKVFACLSTDLNTFKLTNPSPYIVLNDDENERIVRPDCNPVFSVKSGWYDVSPSLEISTTASGGAIYYTTDGTEPNASSAKYLGSILIPDRGGEENIYASYADISLVDDTYFPDYRIDKATVVKAIWISDDSWSQVVSQVYFIGMDGHEKLQNMPIIEITVNPEDFFGYYNGIYQVGNVYDIYRKKYDPEKRPEYYNANYFKEGRGWERPVNITYFDAQHSFVFSQDVGIRIHGGWSTTYNQKGFNLYAREEYDGSKYFNYDFWGKRYNKIMLRTGGYRDIYCTKMRDVLNQRLISNRDVGEQRAVLCTVFLNGEYWGVYNLQETIGESYISEKYNVSADNIIIMKNNDLSIEGLEPLSFELLVAFALENDLSREDNYKYIEDKIDIQSYIDYMAFQIYIANCDSIANNFAKWRTIRPEIGEYGDCKWRFLLYDTDDSTGMVPYLTDYDVDSFTEGHWTTDPLGDAGDILFSALIKNDEFKKRFVLSFMDIANDNFNYIRVSAILKEMSAKYKAGVIASQKRFRGAFRIPEYTDVFDFDEPYDEQDYLNDVKVIDDFYHNRFQYIATYLKKDLRLEGDLRSVNIDILDSEHSSVSLNSISSVSDNWEGQYYSDYPITLECKTDSEFRFAGWLNDKGTIISRSSTINIELTNNISLTAVVEPL